MRIARALFELAGTLSPDKAERAIDTCLANRWVTIKRLGDMVGELGKRGRKGTRLMRRLLLERGEGYVATASELEARFVKLCRKFGITEPVRQQNTGDDEFVTITSKKGENAYYDVGWNALRSIGEKIAGALSASP